MVFFKKFRSGPWPQLGLILAGFVFLLLGLCRQEAATVLTKAIYICLECIGIG